MFKSELHYDSKNLKRIERKSRMSNSKLHKLVEFRFRLTAIFSLRVREAERPKSSRDREKSFWLRYFNVVDQIKFFQ